MTIRTKSRTILITGKKIFGLHIALDPTMPEDRIDFVSGDKVVGRIEISPIHPSENLFLGNTE
jgi:hypothetical protein